MLFLKSSEQQQNEELSISQLQEWLQQRSQEIIERHNLLPAVKEQAKILEDKRWVLETQLDAWQKRTRLHPSAHEVIPLFRETRQLLDLLHFSAQPMIGEVLAANQELEKRAHLIIEKIEAGNFADDFNFLFTEKELNSTNINNGKNTNNNNNNNNPDNINPNSLHNINPLLAALLDLDALRKKLDQQFMESQYHAVQVISSKADYVNKIAVHLQQMKKDLEAKKARQASTDLKKQEKELSLKQLYGDKKSVDLAELTKIKQELQQELDELEMEILSFFSKIKPLLQQYKEREPSNGLLFSYIQEPFSSFFQDEGLFIMELLAKITALLREGKFHLNQENMLSSLSVLEGAYTQRLRMVKEEYRKSQKELQEITEQLHHNYFVIKVDDANYRLEHYAKQAKKIEEELNALNVKVNKIQEILVREREDLQSLIASSLGRKVAVVVDTNLVDKQLGTQPGTQ